MRKIFTKIICFTAAAALTSGVMLSAACSKVYNSDPLTGSEIFTTDAAESNGGFAVEKGGYIYFINGQQTSSADNTFGDVVRGAIMRISKTDFAARNYSNCQTVVPQIAYSGNSNAGIFIYGDYIYYATPSTEKNSDGEVQNSYLAYKRTKLDGTGTMKNYFVQLADNSTEYRYVEENGVVYLIYVAANEDYFGTGTSYKNIHSVNTATGTDTLLAYNVSNVIFDSNDLTNPRVYYTMDVIDYATGTSFSSYYNQIYTVTASETERNKYDFSDVEDYDADKDPLYVNCGTLVFDGIGKIQGLTESVTQFNSKEEGAYDENGELNVDRSAYIYALSSYENGTLFYTRTRSGSSAMLYTASEADIVSDSWKPIKANDDADITGRLVLDGSAASSYTYLFEDGQLTGALIADASGIIKTTVEGGKLLTEIDNDKTFYVTKDGQATPLFTANHGGVNYIYYSLSGDNGNGYTVHRVCYDGTYNDYNKMPAGGDVNDYSSVRILDLDSASDWYLPEMYEGQLMFATQTENMTSFAYIMVCDLRVRENGQATAAVMSNEDIEELNERYESVAEAIENVDDEVYENLHEALHYAFFTGDGKYIRELIKAYQDIMSYDEEHFWSKQSLELYDDFLAARNDYAEFLSDEVPAIKVNGEDVASNRRDYYYSLLGKMSAEDAEAYSDLLKTTYLKDYPEAEKGWFESLSKGAKAGFLIGVIGGGLIVIAAAVIVTLVIIRWRRKKRPVYKKKRIKVDTTDDKNIDVYSE